MTTINSMYALSLDQIEKALLHVGNKRTTLVQGHMGSGKSSLLKSLARALPKHAACYFDCTTKDLGDISMPRLATMDEEGYVSFVPNEELGVHLGKPVILMIDEYGKANPAVKNAMLRIMQERTVGATPLHPESIVFATTNLGAEGVGDVLPPHARNRLIVLTSRKPTQYEWLEWGINNGVDPILLSFVKDNPQLFASFEDITDPMDRDGNPVNPYIYHPRVPMVSFVTPRSLETASDILKQREFMDTQTTTACLIGAIGTRAAMDLITWVKLADQMPSLQSIKEDPLVAKVPDSASATAMVVYRSLQTLERDWVDAWLTYLNRLDSNAQGYFANGVRNPKYPKQSIVMTNAKFRDWSMKNNHLFTADVK